ncbi:unnamed protein product [Musa acuminata subsp. burmannicoides]
MLGLFELWSYATTWRNQKCGLGFHVSLNGIPGRHQLATRFNMFSVISDTEKEDGSKREGYFLLSKPCRSRWEDFPTCSCANLVSRNKLLDAKRQRERERERDEDPIRRSMRQRTAALGKGEEKRIRGRKPKEKKVAVPDNGCVVWG